MNTHQIPHIRIFISSPGDVIQERGIASSLIDALNYVEGIKGEYYLEALRWDDERVTIPLSANETPQKSVNRYLIKPSECDLVLVILWSRMGSRLMLDGEEYLSGTHYELMEAIQGAEAKNGVPEVWVYRRIDAPVISLTDVARESKIQQWETLNTFFDEYQKDNLRGFNAYESPEDFRQQLEKQIIVFLKSLTKDKSRIRHYTDQLPQLWQGSPFPGLRAYTEDDKTIFFGRRNEIDAITALLTQSNFLAVVAASGSGKSSLIAAGVIPMLRDSAVKDCHNWQIVKLHPGEHPFQSLKEALANYREYAHLNDMAMTDNWCETLKETLEQNKQTVLLFIDQFEELFTQTPATERGMFIELITAYTPYLKIILTIRADFYANMLQYSELANKLTQGTFPLIAPDKFTLLEMIERPAERAGLKFEEGLSRRIVQDTGQSPGAIALMAFLLDEMYHTRSEDGVLTHADYEALGGVQGAIGRRANQVYDELPKNVQSALPKVFRELLTITGESNIPTRKKVPLEHFASNDDARQLLSALTHARLLVISQNENPVIEVAHEALFEHWSVLKTWLDETKSELRLLERLRQAANEWHLSGRKDEFRWQHERLKSVYSMLDHLQINMKDLSETLISFIQPEAERLLQKLEESTQNHQNRSDIGKRLAAIGDSRKGIGLNQDGIPDIAWCYVDEGTTMMVGKSYTISPFLIAKYPITNRQFRAFIRADDGYHNEDWWQGMPTIFQKPSFVDTETNLDNYPRTSVSWYQCVAFTHWLHSKLAGQVIYDETCQYAFMIDETLEIRLPTEWEWQKVAEGSGKCKEYPWGDWHTPFANTKESGLQQVISVGMYPAGTADCGAMDMAGNVWEWCLNEYISLSTQIQGDKMRAQRGGSFHNPAKMAHTCYRSYLYALPGLMERFNGFRVCIGIRQSATECQY